MLPEVIVASVVVLLFALLCCYLLCCAFPTISAAQHKKLDVDDYEAVAEGE